MTKIESIEVVPDDVARLFGEPMHLCLVRVEAEGVVGWGEICDSYCCTFPEVYATAGRPRVRAARARERARVRRRPHPQAPDVGTAADRRRRPGHPGVERAGAGAVGPAREAGRAVGLAAHRPDPGPDPGLRVRQVPRRADRHARPDPGARVGSRCGRRPRCGPRSTRCRSGRPAPAARRAPAVAVAHGRRERELLGHHRAPPRRRVGRRRGRCSSRSPCRSCTGAPWPAS